MTTTAELRHLPRAAPGPRSASRVAVLPFDDLTTGSAACPVADTLMALLIAALATRDGLKVVARTASMHYRDSRDALDQIGRALDASRVVEGCVLRLGDQLHVLINFVDTRTGLTLLARSYTGHARTIERVQAAIAWQMADELAAAVKARAMES